MKKIFIVSLVSILFLSIASSVTYFLRYVDMDNLTTFILGIVITVISGVLFAIFHKQKIFTYICLLISAIGLGYLIRAWYIFRGFDNPLWMMLLVSLAVTLYLWVYYLLLYIPFFDKHCGWFTLGFVILSVVFYLIVMANTTTTYVSTFGYYMIIEIAFIIGLCLESNTIHELLKNMVICSYSVFIVALIIGILMLAGDGADFDFDFSLDGGDTSNFKSPKDKKVKVEERSEFYE